MSRRAIRDYILTLAQAATPALTAWEYVPVAQPINDIFMVVSMVSDEIPHTMPIGGGARLIDHMVTVQIETEDISEAVVAQHKDDLVQGFIYQLRAKGKTAPITITDVVATPNETSKIISLGSGPQGRPGIRVIDDWTEMATGQEGEEGLKLGISMIELLVQELITGQ